MEIFHHRDLAGTCGCYGDDFVAEGCNEPLRRWDAIMSSEFEAKLLGGRGHPREIKFQKRTMRWHEEEASFRLEWRSPVRRGTGAVARAHRRQSSDKGEVSRTKRKRSGSAARDALETLDTFQAPVYSDRGGHDWLHRLGQTSDCQFAARMVMSSTREPRKLDWMPFFAVGHVPRVA